MWSGLGLEAACWGWNSGVQGTEGLVTGYRGTGFQAHGDSVFEALILPLFLGAVLFSLGPGALVSL